MKMCAGLVVCVSVSAMAGCTTREPDAAAVPRWEFDPAMVFPADRSLSRPEDGVALRDGRLVVSDQRHGLRLVEPDGASRPFGGLPEAGYRHAPPTRFGAANGVSLEPDGRHLLVADVYGGGIYRVDAQTESAERVYQHAFGVNTARRDRHGGVWFTQSTRNRPQRGEEELWRSVDLQIADGAVYYLPPSKLGGDSGAVELADGLAFANGIALDEDQGWLYVAETMGSRVLRYRVDVRAGRIGARTVALEVDHPDNLELDGDGRLWIACPIRSEIVVFDPDTAARASAFRVVTPESERLVAAIAARLDAREPWLDLMTPGLWEPAPGVITGMILPSGPGAGPVHVTGLGEALVRLPR